MKIFNKIFNTDSNLASLFLRISFSWMMIPHGAGKLFGLFGGFGFEKSMQMFTTHFGIPWAISLFVFSVEFFSSLGILIGLKTRINAFLLASTMFVAGTFHIKYGFYMNWFGKKAGEGFEFHILAVGMMLALMMIGGGKYSLDQKLIEYKHGK